MDRKRKNPAPGFRMPPPYNPATGEHAALPGFKDGARLAVFQVSEEDTHTNYVVCQGFDPEEGRRFEQISVAKPWGSRTAGTYTVGHAIVCTKVRTRLGDNCGVLGEDAEGTDQPASLDDPIEILKDDDDKPIAWMHIGGSLGSTILAVELDVDLWPGQYAAGYILTWNSGEVEYDLPDYDTPEGDKFTVRDMSNTHWGRGYQSNTPERGDIVFTTPEGIVISSRMPIVTGKIQVAPLEANNPYGWHFGWSYWHLADIDLIEDNPRRLIAVDSINIMAPQVEPGVEPCTLREDADIGTYVQARWNYQESRWEIIAVGGSEPGSSSGGGDPSSGGDGSGTSKNSAIVPASWSKTGYTALFVTEAPEVLFDDVMLALVGKKDTLIRIDPRFLEVCEPGTVRVTGCVPELPVSIGAVVVEGDVRVRLGRKPKEPMQVTIRLTGLRKGFRGLRFPDRTKEQFEANEKWIQAAYVGNT